MRRTWAISGVDLHLDVPATRVRAGLEATLREAVETGRLHPGTRLPSSRQLARDLGLARNTVADAYGQLVAEGWLVARQGSGTTVAEGVLVPTPTHRGTDAPVRRPRYDLRPGSPDLSAFPRTAWLAAARRAVMACPAEAFGYSDPRGRPELRKVLAGYLARARGVRTSADRIIVCSGFTQALGLLCRVLRARGATTLATESYVYLAHRKVVDAQGLRRRTVPVDADGADVDRLTDEDAVLLTAAHQFPVGVPLAAARRTAVTAWAARSGGLVVEDDYDGEFRYDRQPVGALQALAPEHVVYIGTASKSLAPGLRLGWLVLPEHLVDEVAEAKRTADAHTGVVEQLTLGEFIGSGAYDGHVRRSRLAYKRRRDTLVTILDREVPTARVSGIAAGLHVLVTLPHGLTETDVVAAAGDRGLALNGLAMYLAGRQRHPPALVVGYATPPDHAFSGAVARLTTTLAGG